MGRGIIPAPWPILHIARSLDTVIDAHGNDKIVDADPVIRYVISIFPAGQYGSGSEEVMSVEYLAENTTELRMTIPGEDLHHYSSGDQVLIGGSVAGGVFVGGTAFRIDGKPGTDMMGPWPRFYKAFGGVADIVRVG